MTRILLLGDSIIDNASYVEAGEPDVTAQLRAHAPGVEVKRRAVDGSVTRDVLENQTKGLQADDVVVISSGGNDALDHVHLIAPLGQTTPQALLLQFWDVREAFSRTYRALMAKVSGERRRVIAMTIYNPGFEAHGQSAREQRAAEAALSIFNDVVQAAAHEVGADVLDIRPIFNDPADYANPIEPSAQGGEKLAQALAARVLR